MKKYIRIISVVLAFALMLVLCSCDSRYETHGIDEYTHGDFKSGNYGDSSTEIDEFGLEDTRFFSDYPYIDAGFDWVETAKFEFFDICETAILYLEYDEDVYKDAKQFCFENIGYLCDEPSEQYKDYLFYDFYHTDTDEENFRNNYPEVFKRVAFNDEENKIVFLGIYTSDKISEEIVDDVNDWGEFLKKYYGEYYSFD